MSVWIVNKSSQKKKKKDHLLLQHKTLYIYLPIIRLIKIKLKKKRKTLNKTNFQDVSFLSYSMKHT